MSEHRQRVARVWGEGREEGERERESREGVLERRERRQQVTVGATDESRLPGQLANSGGTRMN